MTATKDPVTEYLAWLDRRNAGLTPGQADRLRELVGQWQAMAPGEQLDRQTLTDLTILVVDGPQRAARVLEDLAVEIERAEGVLRDARAVQRHAIREASLAGMSEAAIARTGKVNRMTVRAALGK